MKKTITTLAILAFTPLCFAQGGEKERKGSKKALPSHIIEKYDTDGDGALNETERAAAKEAREARMAEMKQVRDSYDVDGNGELDEAEKEAFKAHVKEKMIERFDADGDGALNADELAKAEEARRHLKHKKGKKGKKGTRSE